MSTVTPAAEITITDAGPLENLTIPVPPDGGVVVLTGKNGSGKTTALNSAEALLGGKPSVSARDGSQKAVITGFGATLRVGRRASRTGELEVSSLDGDLSPAKLVDPGLKSPDAADAVRIKALLRLVKAEPDLADFHNLLRDRQTFETYVPEDLSDETDVVALASRIKRSLEQTARREEAIAQNESGKAIAYGKAVEGVDTSAAGDADELQTWLEANVAHRAQLNEQATQSALAKSKADQARAQMAAAEPVRDLSDEITQAGESVSQRAADVYAWRKRQAEATESVELAIANEDSCRRELASAELAHRNAIERRDAVVLRQNDANQHADSMARWEKTIANSEQVECPTPDELEAAEQAITDIRQAIEQAAIIRQAIEQQAKAQEHKQKSQEHYDIATDLRQSAKATDDILSDLVSKCGTDLTVSDGRLHVETRRGLTLFAELSHGERWKIAIDVALQSFPADSEHLPVLTVEQEAWEGLDPANRSIIAEHARERKVLILTAACSADETVSAAEFN